jgi:hypothetical protein
MHWGYRTLEVPMIDVASRVAFIIGASAASVTRGNE